MTLTVLKYTAFIMACAAFFAMVVIVAPSNARRERQARFEHDDLVAAVERQIARCECMPVEVVDADECLVDDEP